MTITAEQFLILAPAASLAVVDDLLTKGDHKDTQLNRILDRHGITEQPAVAQFLTVCHLASRGFTNFDKPIFGVGVLDWLSARARQWQDADLTADALNWDWLTVIETAATLYGLPAKAWLDVNGELGAVCKALGIPDQSEEFALEDRGAMD